MHFADLPQLEHELVRLRPMTAGDIQPWFDYLSLPQVYEHTSWNVQAPDELSHCAWMPEQFTASSPLRFAIALRAGDALVGSAGFHTVAPANASAEIAYDLAPLWWGKGIATAVCAELVRWAHASAGVVRVQATALDTNQRSAAVLERCGFQREGLLRAYRKVRGVPRDFFMFAHVALPEEG